MVEIQRVAPILPVRDVTVAIDHYRTLGFSVRAYAGADPYAFVDAEGVQLHLTEVPSLDPAANVSGAYLYVADADELYERWRSSSAGGHLVAPRDTPWGLREGAHSDPDGNLLRFGSPLA